MSGGDCMLKYKKSIGLFAVLAFSFLLPSCSQIASPTTNIQTISYSSQDLTISSDSNIVKVGETLPLKAKYKNGNATVSWYSENESIFTIDESGLLKGIAVGTAKVTARLKDNLSIKAVYTVNVIPSTANADKANKQELAITTPLKNTEFTQGSFFDLTGLVVKLYTYDSNGKKDGGVEIKDYTSNPANGSYLGTLGSFTATISYPNATSATFDYTVVTAKEDLSLQKVLTNLEDQIGDTNQYKVAVNGRIYTSNGYRTIKYDQTYTEKAYYYNQGTNSYGIAAADDIENEDPTKNHKAGLFYYKVVNNQISPDYYYNHSYSADVNSSYASPVIQFDMLDPDTAPTRLINNSYHWLSAR